MSLLQQLIQLLSQPPGTIIFHLVTLFALQVVFAVSWGKWRRNREDGLARRMAWAAGIIWLLRVALLVVGLIVSTNPTVALLPPLTQALQSLTAVFLLWALSVQSSRWPRPSDTLLGMGVIVILVLTLFFAQAWRTLAGQGILYEASQQALFWLIFQIGIYATGLLLSILDTEAQRSLRPFIFALLLAAKMTQLALPPDETLIIWQRLAEFIAFPLWAALAYRHVLLPLLITEATSQPATAQLHQLLQQTTRMAAQPFDDEAIVLEALHVVQQQIDLSFVALGLLDYDSVRVVSNRPQPHENRPQSWLLVLSHWPALRTAVETQQRVELQPNGLGARQLHQIHEELGLPTTPLPTMVIQPLIAADESVGLLLVSHPTSWSEDELLLIQALAAYVAQLVANGRQHRQALKEAVEVNVTDLPPVGTGRVIALEAENKRLQEEVQLAWDRLFQEEQRTAAARQQARDLVATIEASGASHGSGEIDSLRAEIESLRESLFQAEEALAMASASDSGLSTEWVMHAITRYSGELEEAHGRIEYLEAELRNRHEDSPRYEMITSLAEELRTPLTSIAGYTDLLLGESSDELTSKQQDFLQRVRANTEQFGTVLDQLIHVAKVRDDSVSPDPELVDTREVIESAVHTVITCMQDKNLRLDMNIPDDLDPLSINREALQQIMVNLLDNACQSSPRNGRVAITAHMETLTDGIHDDPVRFVHIAIIDSGRGINMTDQAHVFNPHLQTEDPLIEGLGDTAAGLAVARNLTQTYGGRIWLNSEVGQGSTFSLIFPLNSVNRLDAQSQKG